MAFRVISGNVLILVPLLLLLHEAVTYASYTAPNDLKRILDLYDAVRQGQPDAAAKEDQKKAACIDAYHECESKTYGATCAIEKYECIFLASQATIDGANEDSIARAAHNDEEEEKRIKVMRGMTDIAGLDKVALLKALWDNQVVTFFPSRIRPIFDHDDAAKAVQRPYIDYYCGRGIKLELRKDVVNFRVYDRDIGAGKTGAEIVAQLRSRSTPVTIERRPGPAATADPI